MDSAIILISFYYFLFFGCDWCGLLSFLPPSLSPSLFFSFDNYLNMCYDFLQVVDVSKGIINAIKDPDSRGKSFAFVG